MPQLDPKIGEIYKHFKGNLYQVRDIAIHSETGNKMVVYQALYGPFTTYVRDFDEFISDVDYDKHLECTLRYRFTLVPEGELMRAANKGAIAQPSGDVKELKPFSSDKSATEGAKPAGQPTIQDLMMDFFDEREFVNKEKILEKMKLRDDLTDSVIDNLAAAIDVVIEEGPIDSRFAELRTCVSTRARFENTRLRG